MQVSIRLPEKTLYSGQASMLYGEAENGSFGILPQHADFITSLVPSVFIVTESDGTERFFGLQQGFLVKKDKQVEIVARRGLEGKDLLDLAEQMHHAFEAADEEEREARTALAKLEIGMAKQFRELKRPLV